MKRLFSVAIGAVLAVTALAPAMAEDAKVREGMMVYSPTGQRIAAIYHLSSDGSAQIILDGALVTIPAADLSMVNGKATSSKTKSELSRSH